MKYSKDGYYTNRHSCFLLQYRLVLVTKYRKSVISDPVKEYLISYTRDYFDKMGCVLTEVNAQPDHMHILFEAPPQITLRILSTLSRLRPQGWYVPTSGTK